MTTTKRTPSILPFQISPTLARHPCGTPEKQFNTPSKSRLTTGRTSSATPGNRYIPNRLAGDLEFSRYQVAITPKNNPLGNTSNTSSHGDSSSGRDHASSVMINQLLALKGQKPNSRVLSFQQTPKQQTKGICEYDSVYSVVTLYLGGPLSEHIVITLSPPPPHLTPLPLSRPWILAEVCWLLQSVFLSQEFS